MQESRNRRGQALVGAGVLLVAAVLGVGAIGIPGEAGYQGVGPNFLPWVVTVALALFGLLLLAQALRGDFARWSRLRARSAATGARWPGSPRACLPTRR